MRDAIIFLCCMFLVSGALYTYTAYLIYKKRKAMRYITINERKWLRTLQIVAFALSFGALIGGGALYLG